MRGPSTPRGALSDLAVQVCAARRTIKRVEAAHIAADFLGQHRTGGIVVGTTAPAVVIQRWFSRTPFASCTPCNSDRGREATLLGEGWGMMTSVVLPVPLPLSSGHGSRQ